MRAFAKCLLAWVIIQQPIVVVGQELATADAVELGLSWDDTPHAGQDSLPPIMEPPVTQQAQFMEILPPAGSELDPTAAPSDFGLDTAPFEPPSPIQATDSMISGSGTVVESSGPATYADAPFAPIIDGTVTGGTVTGGTVVEPSPGGSFDYPISDAISSAGEEIYSTSNWFRGGRWYSQQEFVMLNRAKIAPVHVAIDNSGAAARGNAQIVNNVFQAPILHTQDAGFSYQPGARLSLGTILGRDVANRDHAFEVSYFGLFDYRGRAELNAALDFPQRITTLLGSEEVSHGLLLAQGFPIVEPVDGFTDAEAQQLLASAEFDSLEFNYRIGARPGRDRMVLQPDGRWVRHATPSNIRGLYAGLRYIRQVEEMDYFSQGGLSFQTGLPTDEEGEYRLDVSNHMLGMHLGSEWTEKRTNWVVGMRGKVGGLVNFMDRDQFVRSVFDDDNNDLTPLVTTTREEASSDETLSFLAEAGAYVAYYLRPNTSLRFGYEALFINGVATAADNMSLTPAFRPLDTTGLAIYHGMHVGFEMTW